MPNRCAPKHRVPKLCARILCAPRAHAGAVGLRAALRVVLALNVHFHALFLDGAHVVRGPASRPRFHPAPPLTPDELHRVQRGIVRRIERVLRRRGILKDDPASDDGAPEDSDSLLPFVQAASLQSKVTRAPTRAAPIPRLIDPAACLGPSSPSNASAPHPDELRPDELRCEQAGFSLHAATRIEADDRDRLKRLVRHVARPALAPTLAGVGSRSGTAGSSGPSAAPGATARGPSSSTPSPSSSASSPRSPTRASTSGPTSASSPPPRPCAMPSSPAAPSATAPGPPPGPRPVPGIGEADPEADPLRQGTAPELGRAPPGDLRGGRAALPHVRRPPPPRRHPHRPARRAPDPPPLELFFGASAPSFPTLARPTEPQLRFAAPGPPQRARSTPEPLPLESRLNFVARPHGAEQHGEEFPPHLPCGAKLPSLSITRHVTTHRSAGPSAERSSPLTVPLQPPQRPAAPPVAV